MLKVVISTFDCNTVIITSYLDCNTGLGELPVLTEDIDEAVPSQIVVRVL